MNGDEERHLKGQPPPYTEGEVSTTSGVVYQANPPTVVPVLVNQQMGSKPTPTTCPSCNQEIITRVEYKATTKTHLFAVLLCIVFWPCVCLPYCIDSCRNADHYCPNCSAYIGSYKN
ncbi:hypothetical protein PYW07_015859 [Mythimna separata]|uniref:LITAF domain-containing protein n=1 Tax=Mythimna separata TaxID=271217 RepID=A0AAD8DVT4_MYTSE|nr:hypothetical protein PYW07_015859 [Mythimna separata]